MCRNPPQGKGTPHIRRITPRPNKSGKSKPNQVARLIRPTRGKFYTPYAVTCVNSRGYMPNMAAKIRFGLSVTILSPGGRRCWGLRLNGTENRVKPNGLRSHLS